MAIHKKVPDKNAEAPGATKDITLPAFSYQNDRLADLIVAAWANGSFSHGGVTVQRLGDALVKDRDAQGRPTPTARATAKAAVNFFANMDLKSVVVITEEEHDNEYTMQDPDEVVFVLPRVTRLTAAVSGPPYAPDLLETAKLLMACTPNGI
jgi:hypothetical protein